MNFPKLDIEIIENKNSTNMKIVTYTNDDYSFWRHGGTYIWLKNTGNIFKDPIALNMVPLMFGYVPVKPLASLYKYTYQREVCGYRVKKI